MVLLAGPNGAGKSTLYDLQIAPSFRGNFINADVIQRDELRDPSPDAAYRAAGIATRRRQEHIASRRSFVTETVFSHPSKIDLVGQAKAAGFTVFLFHVGVEKADLSVARVLSRVEEGGHCVPEQKIRDRFDRNGLIIREAMLLSDVGHVYDNSRLNHSPERVISFKQGRVSFVRPRLPNWARTIYSADLTL